MIALGVGAEGVGEEVLAGILLLLPLPLAVFLFITDVIAAAVAPHLEPQPGRVAQI